MSLRLHISICVHGFDILRGSQIPKIDIVCNQRGVLIDILNANRQDFVVIAIGIKIMAQQFRTAVLCVIQPISVTILFNLANCFACLESDFLVFILFLTIKLVLYEHWDNQQ